MSKTVHWYGSIVGAALCALTGGVAFAADTTVISSVLPQSRATQFPTPATAFATVINTGNADGIACGIALGTNIPATFSFQTTDPKTNTPIGTPNTGVNIPKGGSQSFVFAVTPTGIYSATVQIDSLCLNAPHLPPVPGVTTINLAASALPVPDIIALAATVTNDGIVSIPGAGASAAFAMASINVGANATGTVSMDTGTATVPLTMTVCPTNSQAQCLSPPAPTFTGTINNGATPTFSIFVTANGTVPFDPANTRIFARFKDAGNNLAGSTSVAVRTQ